jgi:membrane carboxypeptidase/penicillin-binding protein
MLMKLSRVLAGALALVAAALMPIAALALDAPHTLRHARPLTPHLSATGHARSHRAITHRSASASVSRGRHTTARTHAIHSGSARSGAATLRRASLRGHRHRFYERFTASSFASSDIFSDDITAGENPVVRQAAIDALGDMNGTAVVIDPSNGRILAMVNQKLALSPGAEPCSTIKLSVALAALSEGIVTRDTMVRLPGFRMNMTQALAHSNNLYFEELGRELGFERVRHYANQFGLGELAGHNIAGEQLGVYPDEPLSAAEGGVGRMCSFGQGVSMTPLQLGAFVAAIANGGTLYYLQHPTSPVEIASFEPKVKRTLDIARLTPEMQDGMAGAVQYGTARRLRANFQELPVFGKTGTCSDKGTRFGWFVSYSDTPLGKMVTVFFLEGGRPTFGPRAAELTGEFYKNLWDRDYFADKTTTTTISDPAVPVSAPIQQQ